MKVKKFSKKHTDVFKQLSVEVIYLFGSHAGGGAHPMSDVDIGVVFTEPQKYKDNTMEAYSKLYDIFIDVLPKDYLKRRFEKREHDFDLVFLQFAPIVMQYKASRDGIVLYQRLPASSADYKEQSMLHYFDFKFVEDIFNQALMTA
jgi:predicted nucleotidyltransferase